MLICRNVRVSGHRTSIRLDPEMWDSIEEIARREHCTVNWICSMVDQRRDNSSLTAALRAFILHYFRMAATEKGHVNAGHGGLRRRKDVVLPVTTRGPDQGAIWNG